LWPTSLLPMSASDGSPTAVPWARRVQRAPGAHIESSAGVAASLTASASSPAPTPTPSSTTSTTGPRGPANRSFFLSSSFMGPVSLPRTALGPRTALRAAARRPDNATPMVGGTGEAGGGATAARARAVSDALEAARRGDQEALSRLFTEVYDELHELAHLQRRRWSGNHTLDTTALLHESYLRLVDRSRFERRDLGHFFAVACKAMRHILIDYARTRQALKRGGDQEQVPLADAAAGPGGDPEAVIALCE